MLSSKRLSPTAPKPGQKVVEPRSRWNRHAKRALAVTNGVPTHNFVLLPRVRP